MKKITLLCALLLAFAYQGRAQFPAPYCGPIQFTNNEEPITLVQFAGINNASPAPVGQEAHQNFTAIVGQVTQGMTYPITLKGNTDGNFTTYLRVFIDWNQNNVFTDAGESYDIGTITNSTGLDAISLTGDISVPITATAGNTRMRVVKKFAAYSDSCNTVNTGWGEAEDYTLTVTAAGCTPPTLNFDISSLCPTPEFNVYVNLTMGSASSYSVTDNQQSPTQTISADGQLVFGPYASGTEVEITVTDQSASLCNVTSDVLSDICPVTCVGNPSPADAAVDVPAGPITLSWDVPASGGAVEGYDLYVGTTADNLAYFDTYDTNTTADNLVINNFGVTLYWSIVPFNAAGEATGCPVWSFTVQTPPGYCLTAPNGLYPGEVFTPETCDGTTENVIATNCYAGEFSFVNVTEGQTYTFISGTVDFITIANEAGDTPFAYDVTPLTWVSDFTGVVRFFTHNGDQCGSDSVGRTRAVVCGVQTTDSPDYANLQWPPNATISQGNTFEVYGQVYEANLTEPAGQAAGIEAWVGINDADTNPNTWDVTWIPMTFNASANSGNNDEYMATVGADLTPGAYYYALRWRLNNGPFVYGGINTDGTAGNFWDGTTYGNGELTVTDPPVPGNDLCSGAVALTPGGVFDDNDVTGQLLGATTTAGLTFACQQNRDMDVWYSVQVPASGSITIATEAAPGSALTDTVLSVFSGTCGTLTEIGCSDDEGTGAFSTISLTGQTPGATLYIGVWRWTNTGNPAGAFRVSAFDASLSTGEISMDGFAYYPNPVTSVLNVKSDNGIKTVSVYNMLGQQVMQRTVNSQQGAIDMSALSKGAYMVKLTSDTATKTIKVIKE